jgi:hypothetical protein
MKRDEHRVFVANNDGTFTCENCLSDELRARLGDDDVEVWEEYSDGWLEPCVCSACHLSIPVYVTGKQPAPVHDRFALAHRANAAALASYRPGAPLLCEHSTLDVLCSWLQWCDPNGCHTSELAEVEGFDPYTREQAWAAIAAMLDS